MASRSSTPKLEIEMETKEVSILLKDAPLKSTQVSPPMMACKPVPTLDMQSRCIGIVCILVCICTWIGMAELEPVLFAGTPFAEKPFFLQYVANSCLMLCIIPWCVLETIGRMRRHFQVDSDTITRGGDTVGGRYRSKSLSQRNYRKRTMSESTSIFLNTAMMPSYHSIDLTPMGNLSKLSNLSKVSETQSSGIRALVIPSITVSGLLAAQNYLWFMSLYSTIVAVNTTIYQSQCVWVLLFSMYLLGTKPTVSKFMSVLFSVIGVAMISFLGQESEHNAVVNQNALGLVLCLSASVIYALMQVLMSRFEREHFDQDDHVQKLKDVLFFKFMMGAAVFLLWWPGFILLDVVGLETFVFPDSIEIWMNVMTLSVVVITFVIAYLIGITYSGALFMSVGTLLVVPTSYVVDIYLYDLNLSTFTVLGSSCIVVGFLLMQKR